MVRQPGSLEMPGFTGISGSVALPRFLLLIPFRGLPSSRGTAPFTRLAGFAGMVGLLGSLRFLVLPVAGLLRTPVPAGPAADCWPRPASG